jgi:protoheme ferro-lyase
MQYRLKLSHGDGCQAVKFLNSYHDNPLLIEILSKRIQKSFESQGQARQISIFLSLYTEEIF